MDMEFIGYDLFFIFSILGPLVYGILKKKHKQVRILYVGSFLAGIAVIFTSKDTLLLVEPLVFMAACFIFYRSGLAVRSCLNPILKLLARRTKNRNSDINSTNVSENKRCHIERSEAESTL